MTNDNRKRLTASDRPEALGSILDGLGQIRKRTAEEEAEFRAKEVAAQRHREAVDRSGWLVNLERELGPRYGRNRVSLDTYSVYDEEQRKVIKRVREIESKLEAMIADGAGLVLFGWVGTGKDHLAAALLYSAVRLTSCKWANGRKVFGESRDRIKEERTERELIDSLTRPGVLCISDAIPIEGRQSDWNTDLMYRVVDERYHLLRPTWITANVRDTDDAQARFTQPVWDRLRDQAELIPCFWSSFRRERK